MGYSAKQRKIKFEVEGADEIVKSLKEMEEAASDVLKEGAEAGGKIALSYAREHCPVDTGALRNSLALSDDKVTETKATVKVDYDKSIKYGTFVELGAQGRKPNPFLRNAVDSNINAINEAITSAISNAIGRRM